MGLSYQIAKKNHRKVTGLLPEVYKDSLNDLECDYSEITTSIIDSTMKIYKNSDAIIFLPGGLGTIYEFFTANYCKICNEIDIPIIIYNSHGYFDKVISFIEDAHKNKFIKDKDLGKYVVANTKEEVLTCLKKD